MAFHFFFLVVASLSVISAQKSKDVVIVVNGTQAVANTDPNYICATIDWWPPDKCNYRLCPWHSSSIINLDLSHPTLVNAIQAFDRLRIRVGGSLQDRVLYDVGNMGIPCRSFSKMGDGLFGFSKGCLHMDRWDEVNHFFNKTGVIVTFGLNALHGRHQISKKLWGGDWNSSNAKDFIKYTISKGYRIDSWEFGNELSGAGVGANVGAEQYARDLIEFNTLLDELYKDFNPKPKLAAPGGFYDEQWFNKVLQVSGSQVINAVTHHLYNLGAGVDRNLVSRILNPDHLSKAAETFRELEQTIKTYGPWAAAWVGESGGAYNSGGRNVSDAFVNCFWYLDQLGMAAKYETRVYCRQTLIGGYYGLLDAITFVPNPDYYSALLWHSLMGKEVLAVDSSASPYLRTYAHCSKGRAGVTLLVINLSNQTEFHISVQNSINSDLRVEEGTSNHSNSFVHGLKNSVSWVGRKASAEALLRREEYHLTPEDGNLQSRTMLLNGKPLQLTSTGDIPSLKPALVDMNSPMLIAPLSIKFLVLPYFEASVCK